MDSSVDIDSIIIWNEYVYLEDDFIECIRYLPLVPACYKVWSAHFADLIIRIGSVFDSFFKRAIFCESLDDVDHVKECRERYKLKKEGKRTKNIDIRDYYEIFEQLYNLSSKDVHNLHTFETVTPFSEWIDNYESLEWWDAYNDLKHDRFANKKVATLGKTLNALGGLFLLNILHLDTAPNLVDYGIIKSNYSKQCLKNIVTGKEVSNGIEPIYAKTKLFGHIFDSEKREISAEYKKHILSPSYLGYG